MYPIKIDNRPPGRHSLHLSSDLSNINKFLRGLDPTHKITLVKSPSSHCIVFLIMYYWTLKLHDPRVSSLVDQKTINNHLPLKLWSHRNRPTPLTGSTVCKQLVLLRFSESNQLRILAREPLKYTFPLIAILKHRDCDLDRLAQFCSKWAVWGDSSRTNVAVTVSINVSVEALHIKTVR